MTGSSHLLDVNALSVALVADHPGHEYVWEALGPGLQGEERLLLFDHLPLRAYWVLTTQWNVAPGSAREAVGSFLRQPLDFVAGGQEMVREAFELSDGLDHDVYDCFYLALAETHDAETILTTDTDFERLCDGRPVRYHNPVPDDVLAEFHRMNRDGS